MKAFAWMVGLTTMLAAGAYSVVSLVRWEWNRALFFGLVFLAAEVGCAAALLLRRMGQLEQRGRAARSGPDEIERAVRRARIDHERFPWLGVAEAAHRTMTQTNVFVTMVVGGGVLLSGLAWLIDKIASASGDDAREHRLAEDLRSIDYPSGGLVVDDVTVLARSTIRRDDPRVGVLLGHRPNSSPEVAASGDDRR